MMTEGASFLATYPRAPARRARSAYVFSSCMESTKRLDVAVPLAERLDQVEPVRLSFQGYVHDGEVRLVLPDQLERLLGAACLADDREVVLFLDDLLHALADKGVVVDDDDLQLV